MLSDQELLKLAQMTPEVVQQQFHTQTTGLTSQQATARQQKYGSNQLVYHHKAPLYRQFLQAFATPFTLVLLVLAVISFWTDYVLASPADKSFTATVIILVMVIVSGTMTLIQSVQSTNAAEKLQSLVQVNVQVFRDQQLQTIALADLVPGDIVKLAAGDLIPADLRVLQARDLLVSQTALTGESYPVEKVVQSTDTHYEQITDLKTLIFMGSNVVSGTALALVVATGQQTRFGEVTQALTNKKATVTNFDVGISQTSWLLIRFMAIMAPIVCVLNGLTKGNWLQALLFGVSTAVGLTPEMLPVIVTTNLVRGALTMAKQQTVVKDLNAIQNFGAMDVLCTDKTGTLTKDQIILEHYLDVHQQVNPRVLQYAYLNSQFQTGLNNLMDQAIIQAATTLNLNVTNYQKIDEIPFDFQRRRLSTVVQMPDQTDTMVTKGAFEEILQICSYVEDQGQVVALTPEWLKQLQQQVRSLNQAGLRVLGLAYKTNPQASADAKLTVADEQDMVFLGYLTFLDPPKQSVKQALSSLAEYGTQVKIITGDNQLVTLAVCQKINFAVQNVLTGQEISQLTPEQLQRAVETTNVFVKVGPEQKALIVQALRKNQHVVGFLGDGINDAPAMKAADVGISVDSAVDIAKESAAIILLQKDLQVLEQGVLVGRQTFGNIMKYIKATCSSNFGNMLSVLCASIFLPFLPMQPLQLLFLNLTYDLSCLVIPWDRMDPEYLKVPRKWEARSIGRFMAILGPTSSLFDITTYLAMYFVICPQVLGHTFGQVHGLAQQEFIQIFNSGWFVESLWTQTLVLHAFRTQKIPFVQSRASQPVLLITTIAVIVGSLIPFTAIGHFLKLAPLPTDFWWLLGLTVVCYLVLVTIVKKIYVQRYGELL